MVAQVSVYTAEVQRDGRYWLIRVPEVDRWTQARSLREVETMARDLVAVMRDVDPDSFELAMEITLPEQVRKHLEAAARLREESARANAAAAKEARAAARALADMGMSLRDVGVALGVSPQRASQLLAG